MKNLICLLGLNVFFLLSFSDTSHATPCASGEMGGVVFRDVNANGVFDSSEYGYPSGGFTVKAYDASGSVIATATPGSDGAYTLGSISVPVRLELSDLPTYLKTGAVGTNSESSVLFSSSSSCSLDFAVQNPGFYCDSTNPSVTMSCYQGGSGVGNTNASLVSFPYNAYGIPPMLQALGGKYSPSNYSANSDTDPTNDVSLNDIGSVWGIAYRKTAKRLFAGALLKRHVGLGSGGLSTIYVVGYSTGTAALEGQFSLEGVVPSNSATPISLGSVTRNVVSGAITTSSDPDNALSSNVSQNSRDIDAYTKVLRNGFGDLALTEDEKQLWAVNLYQKTLLQLDATLSVSSLPGSVTSYDISSIPNLPTCTGGEVRPFALEFFEGKGFLGIVCDASVSQDRANLTSYVLSFNPADVAAGFTTEVTIPLNHIRERIYPDDGQDADTWPISGLWRPWTDPSLSSKNQYLQTRVYHDISDPSLGSDTWQGVMLSYPQPALANIRFSESGSMVLSYMDRSGHQFGNGVYAPVSSGDPYDINRYYFAGGDLVQVCRVGNSWVVEGNSGCTVSDAVTKSQLQSDGPSGNGEFYYWDGFGGGSDTAHSEVEVGGALVVPGTREVLSSVYDPFRGPFPITSLNETGGVRKYSTVDGNKSSGGVSEYMLVPRNGDVPGYLGKAAGLGEPLARCALQPIEIGNRIWIDTDKDGIQDPGEVPLSGVTIKLLDASGVEVGSAVTDSEGRYIFSSASGSSTGSFKYGISSLVPGLSGYSLSISLSQSALSGYTITNKDQGSSDSRDSDGSLSSGAVVKSISLGDIGSNDHTFDFGFVQSASLGNYVWFDANANGIQDSTESGISGVTVTLIDALTGLVLSSKVTDSSGYYLFGATDGVQINGSYKIVLNNPSDYLSGGPLYGISLTSTSSGSDDAIDSDASTVSGYPTIMATAPGANQSDLTFDFGFIPSSGISTTSGIQVSVDSSASSLNRTVKRIVNALSSTSARTIGARCKRLSSRSKRTLTSSADNYYREIWRLVWSSIPTLSFIDSGNLSARCTVRDLTSTKSSLSTNISRLRSVASSLLTQCGTLTSRGKSFSTELTREYRRVSSEATQIPSSLRSCS